MKVQTFVTGPIQVNTYVVFDEQSKEGILIDVGGAASEITAFVKKNDIKLKGIYNTHGHFDHVMGAKEIQDVLNIGFYLNKEDLFLVEHLTTQLAMYGIPSVEPPVITSFIDENTEIMLGDSRVKILSTPGHTPGGICFLADNLLFSGDTLFLESIGRTDLPGGDYLTLKNSIREKLFVLNDDVIVYPGHDDPTSILHERKYNKMV